MKTDWPPIILAIATLITAIGSVLVSLLNGKKADANAAKLEDIHTTIKEKQ